MPLFHHYHHSLKQRSVDTDVHVFEFSVWLHVFSRSLVSVFIPILLLQAGYSIGEVMIYYLIFNTFDVPLNFLAGWLTRKIGARWVIILGSLASVAFFVCLYNITDSNWLLLIAMALFAALYDVLYWVAHIYYFIKCSKNDDDVAKDTGTLKITRQLAGLLAPGLGAVIMIFWHQKALIVISVIILLISTAVLFRIKDTKDKPVRQKKLREFFNSWADLKDYISVGLYGIHLSAEVIIWPIFIFSVFASIDSVAWLPMIISVTTIIFTYFTSRVPRKYRNKLIIIGGLLVATTWILRLLITDNYFFYISVFLTGFAAVLIGIPLHSNIYEKGERKDTLSTAMYRNTFSMATKIPLYGALVILVNVFHVSFIVAAIGMFLMITLHSIFRGKPPVKTKSRRMKEIRVG